VDGLGKDGLGKDGSCMMNFFLAMAFFRLAQSLSKTQAAAN